MVRSALMMRAAAQAAALTLMVPVASYAVTSLDRVPLPVPRPAWLDGAPNTTEAVDARPEQTAGQAAPAPVRLASLPSHVPLPIPRPDWLDATTDSEPEQVSRVAKSIATEDDEQSLADRSPLHAMIEEYARRHGVPVSLAHRIVQQESRYNPALKAKAHFGLMQVSPATAKSMGYAGDISGLLDARTNLTYAMPYLANAWIVSGGHEGKARSLYMSGYYPEAKRKGLLKDLRQASSPPVTTEAETADAR